SVWKACRGGETALGSTEQPWRQADTTARDEGSLLPVGQAVCFRSDGPSKQKLRLRGGEQLCKGKTYRTQKLPTFACMMWQRQPPRLCRYRATMALVREERGEDTPRQTWTYRRDKEPVP